jgi:hypothetical protein
VAGEHELVVDLVGVADLLQRLLDAEAARIGEAAGRILLIVRPGGEAALAEATHAIGLILADDLHLLGRHEHQRVVRRLERVDVAEAIPFAGTQQIVARHPEALALDADVELELVIACRLARKGDLALGARFEIAQEGIAHGARIEAGRREFVE